MAPPKKLTLPSIRMVMVKAPEKDKKLRIGITHGDLNGISYEVIIKALNDNRLLDMFTPVIYGFSKVLSYNRKNLNLNDFNYKVIRDADQSQNQKVNIVNLSSEEIKIEFGKSTEIAGSLAYKALEQSVQDLKEDKIDVLVTAPLDKSNIQSKEFTFPGHTEYLTERFGSESALMLMVHDNLRVGTITGHIPLKDVPGKISEELIMSKISILNESLIKDFGISKPKIAVLGINPHSGDKGVIGDEEQKVVIPALANAKDKGFIVFGPFPADGFFGSDEYKKYDAVLAMYHDQGLIPFKAIAFEGGVNFTAGLPIVRTSPAHGTAYDKAGKNISSCKSMRQAIYLAIDIYRNRANFEEMNQNPIPTGLIHDTNNARNGRNNQRDSEELIAAQD
jgi:4-hydroxythreonine-4-phosphate dehydrogenase